MTRSTASWLPWLLRMISRPPNKQLPLATPKNNLSHVRNKTRSVTIPKVFFFQSTRFIQAKTRAIMEGLDSPPSSKSPIGAARIFTISHGPHCCPRDFCCWNPLDPFATDFEPRSKCRKITNSALSNHESQQCLLIFVPIRIAFSLGVSSHFMLSGQALKANLID